MGTFPSIRYVNTKEFYTECKVVVELLRGNHISIFRHTSPALYPITPKINRDLSVNKVCQHTKEIIIVCIVVLKIMRENEFIRPPLYYGA